MKVVLNENSVVLAGCIQLDCDVHYYVWRYQPLAESVSSKLSVRLAVASLCFISISSSLGCNP
jgi:hypothetical protein